MVVSGALAVIKITAGLMGHSTAVVADGLESAGDVFASGIVLLGLTLAAKPADWNHPYGHGRIETVTGLFVGFMLAMAGLAISTNALHTIGAAAPPPAPFVVWPLIGSGVAKSLLSGVKFHYGKKIRSAALVADAWNDSVDILSALAVIYQYLNRLSDRGALFVRRRVGHFDSFPEIHLVCLYRPGLLRRVVDIAVCGFVTCGVIIGGVPTKLFLSSPLLLIVLRWTLLLLILRQVLGRTPPIPPPPPL